MAKKLLSEAQVRKFMGLANLDANLSSNFLNEMYGEPAKRDDEMMQEEEEMEMGAEVEAEEAPEGDADTEGGDLGATDKPDVELDEEEVAEAQAAMEKVQAVLSKLMAGAGPEMDDMPAEEPMGDMEMDAEIDADVDLEPTEDEIVAEVARRVARRINEAARAQKKADRLLGRKK